jgi:hypothetical protein
MRSIVVKLLSKIKVNSVNTCDFFKFIIVLRGGHYYYSHRAPRNLAYIKDNHDGIFTLDSGKSSVLDLLYRQDSSCRALFVKHGAALESAKRLYQGKRDSLTSNVI